MHSCLINRVISATVVLATAVIGGLSLPQRADATTTGCSGGTFCIDYSLLGDANYTEVALTGSFEGNAAAAIQQLKLCDEKSDQTAASGTITIAERRSSDGAVTYRQYPDQEFIWGPKAGCRYVDLPDYSGPSGKYLWAIRADYSYNQPFGLGVSAQAQTYHTAWAYNWYLRNWCPTCA